MKLSKIKLTRQKLCRKRRVHEPHRLDVPQISMSQVPGSISNIGRYQQSIRWFHSVPSWRMYVLAKDIET